MTQNSYPLYPARIWRMGRSSVFPLYKQVMEAIGAKIGDLVLIRVHPPYVTFRIAHPNAAIPDDTFEGKDLPPSWPGKNDNQREERK